jgi:hypothetical protein
MINLIISDILSMNCTIVISTSNKLMYSLVMGPGHVAFMSSCPLYTGYNYMHYSSVRKMRRPL